MVFIHERGVRFPLGPPKKMYNIGIIQPIHQEGIKILEKNEKFNVEIIDDISIDNLKKKITKYDGISIRTANLTSEILSKAINLKIISRHGVGFDNIDLKTAKNQNITITITTNANAVAVAEHVMFMILNIAKRKNMYDDNVRKGEFSLRNKLPKTIELWNKKMLIIGFGRIGQCLIKRCKAFEMQVFVYDPFVTDETITQHGGIKINNIIDNIGDMNFISLHLPLNNKTKNLFNYEMISKLRKDCILINAARGGIVNEDDLNRSLNENKIFGAGLDVFEKEPPNKDSPLLKNKKVFLSPHTAAFTEECMIRMAKETTKNIIDFFNNNIDKSKIIKS